MNKLSLFTLSSVAALCLTSPAFADHHEGEEAMRGDHHKMNKMHHMHEMADTNKDGVVSKEEFQAMHKKHFSEADTNGDGKITMEEFSAHQEMMAEKRQKAMQEKKKEKRQKAFSKLDANGDGTVTKEEFDAMGEKKFSRMDRNEDGVLNEEDRKRKYKNKKKSDDSDN